MRLLVVCACVGGEREASSLLWIKRSAYINFAEIDARAPIKNSPNE